MSIYLPHRPQFFEVVSKEVVVEFSFAKIMYHVDEHNITVFEYVMDEEDSYTEETYEVKEDDVLYGIACAVDLAEDFGKVITEEDAKRMGDFFRWNDNCWASWEVIENICGIKDAYAEFPYTYDEALKRYNMWRQTKKINDTYKEGAD